MRGFRPVKTSKPIVVKVGGAALGSGDTTLSDLVTLQQRGVPAVVVHGGGNKVTSWLDRMGVATRFVRGARVTDEDTLQVVVAVLAGLVNKELVAGIASLGGKAIGISGVDGALVQARIGNEDMGYVGEVVKVDPEPVNTLLKAGYMPVIGPAGLRSPGADNGSIMLLNINADVAACEIAIALGAEKLIFLTDVPGIKDGEGRVLPRLSPTEARGLVESGTITGGMIPKVEACVRALSAVPITQIIDGRSAGALLAVAEGGGGGTRIE
jgi:acetylglutamate kinase